MFFWKVKIFKNQTIWDNHWYSKETVFLRLSIKACSTEKFKFSKIGIVWNNHWNSEGTVFLRLVMKTGPCFWKWMGTLIFIKIPWLIVLRNTYVGRNLINDVLLFIIILTKRNSKNRENNIMNWYWLYVCQFYQWRPRGEISGAQGDPKNSSSLRFFLNSHIILK